MFDFNAWLNRYPGTNFHELNIDWLVNAMKALASEMHDFEMVNQIKYMGTWSITKQYPAWSIVIDGNTGYISKEPVPAGIAISNTEYWEVVANFTALIGDLGDRVEDLEEDMAEVKPLAFRNNDHWSQHKVIFVGDSYAAGQTATPGVYINGYPHYVNEVMVLGAYYNLGVTNAGWSNQRVDNLRFGKQLFDFKNSHTASECEAITDIVIAGGINDCITVYDWNWDTTDDYCPRWTYNYIKQYFPNARVYLGFINRIPQLFTTGYTFNKLRDVIQKYKNLATKYGWKYIVNSEYMCHTYEDLDTDGLHMVQSGYEKIGKRLAEYLNNGSWVYPQEDGAPLVLTPYDSADSDHIVLTNVDGKIGIYNQHTNAGVQIFTNTYVRATFAERTQTFESQIYLGKYWDKATKTYPKFIMQYDDRITCDLVFLSGDTVVNSCRGFLNFKANGDVSVGTLTGHAITEAMTFDNIYIAFNPVTFDYSVC